MSQGGLSRVIGSTRALKIPKGTTSRKTDVDRWIREPEVRSLLRAARSGQDPWAEAAYDSILLAANLGLRASEVVDLMLHDFQLLKSHNAITIRSCKSQKRDSLRVQDILDLEPAEFKRLKDAMARKERLPRPRKIDTIYVSDAERELFLATLIRRQPYAMGDRFQRLFPFSKRYFQYLFDYYRSQAGLNPGLSSHSLRRFVATRIASQTGDVRLASLRLRHHQKNVTLGYVEFPPERQIELLNRLDPVY